MCLDDFCQIQVPCYHGHLVRGLSREVERLFLGTPEQERPGAGLLVVYGTDVEGRVSARVPGVQVRRVEEESLQVLDQTVAASLHREGRKC